LTYHNAEMPPVTPTVTLMPAMSTHLISDDLTTEDKAAGFALVEVENPEAMIDSLSPPAVMAVVYSIGPSDRIIKFNNPANGRSEYRSAALWHL